MKKKKFDVTWGPLKKLPEEKPFIVWDVETRPHYPGEPISTEWLGAGLYNGTGEPVIHESEEEFFSELLSFQFDDHWIYAHNASGFDFHYLMSYLCRKRIPWQGYRAGQRFFVETCNRRFFDSMAVLAGPLRSIGDMLGLKTRKWSVPQDFYEQIVKYWKEGFAIEYLKDDLRSLFEAIQVTRENFAKLGGVLQPTIASTAMTLFRHKYMTHTVQSLPPWATERDTWRKAYLGGRVEVFKGKMGEGASWDINSSYPASMVQSQGIPCDFLGEFEGNNLPSTPAICKAFVDVPEMERHPPLPIVGSDDRLYFPTGVRKGWFTSEELAYCIDKYGRSTVKIERSHLFEPKPLFDDYVRDLYAIKQKKAGVLSFVAKLAMNSLYGKTGQHPERELIVCGSEWHDWPWEFPEALEDFKKRGVEPYKRVISDKDFIYAIPQKGSTAPYIQPQIAATVTARGRLRLQRLLDQSGDASCYCDTDSLYAELPSDAHLSRSELGALKLETTIEKAIFAAPKVYWIKTRDGTCKGKAKGVSYRDAAEVLRFIEGEAVKVKRMMGLFEARRRADGKIQSEWQEKRARSFELRRHTFGPFSTDHMKKVGLLSSLKTA